MRFAAPSKPGHVRWRMLAMAGTGRRLQFFSRATSTLPSGSLFLLPHQMNTSKHRTERKCDRILEQHVFVAKAPVFHLRAGPKSCLSLDKLRSKNHDPGQAETKPGYQEQITGLFPWLVVE